MLDGAIPRMACGSSDFGDFRQFLDLSVDPFTRVRNNCFVRMVQLNQSVMDLAAVGAFFFKFCIRLVPVPINLGRVECRKGKTCLRLGECSFKAFSFSCHLRMMLVAVR